MNSSIKKFITIVSVGCLLTFVLFFALGNLKVLYGSPAPMPKYKTVLLTGAPTGSAEEQREWFEKWLNTPDNKGWRFVQLIPSNGQNMPFKAPMVVLEKE